MRIAHQRVRSPRGRDPIYLLLGSIIVHRQGSYLRFAGNLTMDHVRFAPLQNDPLPGALTVALATRAYATFWENEVQPDIRSASANGVRSCLLPHMTSRAGSLATPRAVRLPRLPK